MEMELTITKKIYPTADELSKITSVLHCTEKGCQSIFTSKSNLTLHLAKTHKKEHLLTKDEIPREYYCPEINCIYNKEKHFKKMKYLKQHYLKVHSEKTFACNICGKGFSTENTQKNHTEYCGITFNCLDCNASYPAYESLLTHGRRKKHKILEKSMYKKTTESIHNLLQKSGSCDKINEKQKFILPKGSVSLQLLCYKIAFDKSSQTDLNLKTRLKRDKNTTRETQTNKDEKMQISAETQTIGDYAAKKLDLNLQENKKSIKTQTKEVYSQSKSCNTLFNLNEFDFTTETNVERNSSSTQTNIKEELIYSTETTTDLLPDFEFIDTSSQTNFSEDMDAFDSETFFNCNSETQTDFIFENEFLNTDFYTNMYTQTCNDSLLNELEFNNIHTQTVLDEMLRSVESQTTMSHNNNKNLLTCRDMANMETQTDVEFKQMLEEINA